MPRHVGLDVHKAFAQVCILAEGETTQQMRVPCTREQLELFAKFDLRPSDRVALEATTNTWAVVRAIEPYVAEVVVSNPLKTKAIAAAKVKTDKVDASVLARLLRSDFLPPVWHPDHQTATIRHVVAWRSSLVSERTRVKNRIHSILAQRLIPVPFKVLWSPKGLDWLRRVALEPIDRQIVDSELRLLDATDREVRAVDKTLTKEAYEDPRVRLLMTLPGVDFCAAHSYLAAVGDLDRFVDGDHVASYIGLVPSTRASAQHCYHGPITKQGRSHTRWMLIQAAQHIAEHPGPLGQFFRKVHKKKNRNVAVVATARKLAVIAYHMLKHNEPYRYALPDSTAHKLAHLRAQATGLRRQTGPSKDATTKRTVGIRSRTIPSLPDVYRREGLPECQAPEMLPNGEKRMLEERKLRPFLQTISHPQRHEKKSAKAL
jgi:transposase